MVKSPLTVIDAHMHCGGIDRSIPQSCVDYWRQVVGTDIGEDLRRCASVCRGRRTR